MSDALGTLEQAAATLGTLLQRALAPLDSSSPSPGVKAMAAELGWLLPDPVPPALLGLKDSLTTFAHAIDELDKAIEGGGEAAIVAAGVKCVAALIKVIEAFADLPGALDAQLPAAFKAATNFKNEFSGRLLEFLIVDALWRRQPMLSRILRLIGLIEIAQMAENPAKFQPDFTLRRLHLERIATLFSDPVKIFQDVYGWGSSTIKLAPLHEALQSFSIANGYPGIYDYPSLGLLKTIAPFVTDPAVADRSFEFILFDAGAAKLTAALTAIPKASPNEKQGIAIALNATGSFDKLTLPIRPDLKVTLTATLDASAGLALTLKPGQAPKLVSNYDGPATPASSGQLAAMLSYHKLDGGDPIRIVSFPGGSRLEADEIYLTGGLGRTKAGVLDPRIEVGVQNGRLVISLGGADGFLSTLLPSDGLAFDFDLGVGWSQQLGVYVEGAAGIEINIPLHLEIGPVALEYLFLKFAIESGGTLTLEASVGATGALGPLAASIDRVGLKATTTFPAGGGNVGPANIDLAFKPPQGVGLSLDCGIVKGGGYLYIDTERGEYAGALELIFADFLSLHAIGLINTKMPDGSNGFSLLVIITAEFGSGIQLGFGFTLLGVGGLVGLNRTMLLQPLMEGVRTGAVESIMFPKDVVANAQKIISDLKKIFPPAEGIFLIGPMAKIGWGTPTLVSLSLGVIIEIPGNIALVGVLKVALPAEDAALIVMQVNFAGALEFDKKRLYFFASLFDSRVLFITIEGDIGVLFAYGDDADFVLSVGGFHPRFNPPPLPFPSLRRIEVNIINESYARIRCDGYFAVTTNTLQFGSHSEYFFGFDALSVEGNSGFDALIQFSPFYFSVSIETQFSVKVFGVGVYGIGISLTLEGPTPWHASGYGSLSFLFFSVDVPIDFTWGDSRNTSLPPVAAMPIIAGELGKKSNWRALPPKGSNLLVSLRQFEATEDDLVLHPVGTLHISQRAIPLDLNLDKIGNQKPTDAKRFALTTDGGGLAKLRDVDEQFAPSQFRNADDATKLSQPAYTPQHAGVELSAAGSALRAATALTRIVRYDLTVIDSKLRRARRRFHRMARGLHYHFLRGASMSRNPLSAYHKAQTHPYAEAVKVSAETFTVARQADNRAYGGAAMSFTSQAAADDHIGQLVAGDPSLAGTLHVLPQFEVAA